MLDLHKTAGSAEPSHKVSWDLTINVPTMLALTIALITGVAWGISKYDDVDNRISATVSDTRMIRRDVDRLDLESKALRAEQSSKLDALRGEMRGELRDVNGKLDQLLLRGGRGG